MERGDGLRKKPSVFGGLNHAMNEWAAARRIYVTGCGGGAAAPVLCGGSNGGWVALHVHVSASIFTLGRAFGLFIKYQGAK